MGKMRELDQIIFKIPSSSSTAWFCIPRVLLRGALGGIKNILHFQAHFSLILFFTRGEFLKPPVIFINHTETVIFSDSGGMAKVPSAEDIVANVLITD